MRFDGKVAVVTGGARGIGGATAIAFAAEGARVAFCDIRDGDETLRRIEAAGAKGSFFRADVSDPEAMRALVAHAVTTYGRLDVFVCNAAYSDRGPFHTIPLEAYRRTLDVTMWGPLYGLRAATEQFIKQGAGGS